jgi:hypothetical protein
MGNILDEYLDPSEYQVVSCQINDQVKKLEGENDQINKTTIEEIVCSMKVEGNNEEKENRLIDIDVIKLDGKDSD